MKATRLVLAKGLASYIAIMEDGSLKIATETLTLLSCGPKRAWFEARERAGSVSQPPGHDRLLATVNKKLGPAALGRWCSTAKQAMSLARECQGRALMISKGDYRALGPEEAKRCRRYASGFAWLGTTADGKIVTVPVGD